MDTTPNFFEIIRSIRQRCPISALFFILVAEIIANIIREIKKERNNYRRYGNQTKFNGR